MRYQSANEYFYKLYARLFMLLLLPLAAFLFVFIVLPAGWLHTPLVINEQTALLLRYIFSVVAVAVWLVAAFYFRSVLRPVRTLVSLGDRLNRYYSITVIRFTIIIASLLLLTVGYYLLADEVLTAFFIASLLLLVFIWPFPRRVVRHLHLKEDEQRWLLDRV